MSPDEKPAAQRIERQIRVISSVVCERCLSVGRGVAFGLRRPGHSQFQKLIDPIVLCVSCLVEAQQEATK